MRLLRALEYAFAASVACYTLSALMTAAFLFSAALGMDAGGTFWDVVKGLFLYSGSKIVVTSAACFAAGLLLDVDGSWFSLPLVFLVYCFDAATLWALFGRVLYIASAGHAALSFLYLAANMVLGWACFAAGSKRAAGRRAQKRERAG